MRRGLPSDAFDGRPFIAIANSASDLTPCNAHLDEVARHVALGITEAGRDCPEPARGVARRNPGARPTAMLWRNMAAMAAEEMFRANPIDGLVLLGGCDKTIPALLMAAASVDLPAVVVPGGPMLTGTFRGVATGCGTDVWRLSEEVRAGTSSAEQFARSESSMIRSRATATRWASASTMALVTEALGMIVPGIAGTPAPDSRLLTGAHHTGRLIVEMIEADRRPSQVMTRASFLNAIVALAVIGGSTNAVIHLLAIAGRLGVELSLGRLRSGGSEVPLLVNLEPARRFLMEDFDRAGCFWRRAERGARPARSGGDDGDGRPLVDELDGAEVFDQDVIRPRSDPLLANAGIAVLRGNIAPTGAIIKPAAASESLLQHRGRAVVFDGVEHFHARIDAPDLEIDADSVMVLRGCGPRATRHARGGESCRCRRSCSSRAFATWSASATDA